MSSLATNAITDASGGNTTTINGYTPTVSNMAGRNRIINGDMRIDQRNNGAAVTVSSSYPVDRFRVLVSTDGAFSAQQVSESPVGFSYSLKFTTTTADSSLAADQFVRVRQQIEGFNFADLMWGTANAKTVTLSFWTRSSLTGTFGAVFRNSDNDRSYPFTYTISSADTWEYKTIVVPGDTSGTWVGATNGIGLRMEWGLGVGSSHSGTAGSWQSAQYLSATGAVSVIGTLNATWYVTGVQLEAGSVATPFEHRQYGQELALCQRYYENNYPTGTAVGSIMGDNVAFGLSYRSGTATPYFGMVMQQRKRATPTFTVWNGVTGTSGTWRGSSSSNQSTTISGNEVSFVAQTTSSDSLIRSAFFEANAEL